jgi:hypothetical protein
MFVKLDRQLSFYFYVPNLVALRNYVSILLQMEFLYK